MATFNLDQRLSINDNDPITHSEGHPGAGAPQALFGQDHSARAGDVLQAYSGTDLYSTCHVGGWEAGNFHRVLSTCGAPSTRSARTATATSS